MSSDSTALSPGKASPQPLNGAHTPVQQTTKTAYEDALDVGRPHFESTPMDEFLRIYGHETKPSANPAGAKIMSLLRKKREVGEKKVPEKQVVGQKRTREERGAELNREKKAKTKHSSNAKEDAYIPMNKSTERFYSPQYQEQQQNEDREPGHHLPWMSTEYYDGDLQAQRVEARTKGNAKKSVFNAHSHTLFVATDILTWELEALTRHLRLSPEEVDVRTQAFEDLAQACDNLYNQRIIDQINPNSVSLKRSRDANAMETQLTHGNPISADNPSHTPATPRLETTPQQQQLRNIDKKDMRLCEVMMSRYGFSLHRIWPQIESTRWSLVLVPFGSYCTTLNLRQSDIDCVLLPVPSQVVESAGLSSSSSDEDKTESADIDSKSDNGRNENGPFLVSFKQYARVNRVSKSVLEGFKMSRNLCVKFLEMARRQLLRDGCVDYCEDVFSARVPILKIRHKASGVYCDVACGETSGLRSTYFMWSVKEQVPCFGPLVLILKELHRIRRLDVPFTGGAGSYLLQLMVMVYLQWLAKQDFASLSRRINPKQQSQSDVVSLMRNSTPFDSLGSLFLGYLYFYGCVFKYEDVAASLSHCGSFARRARDPYNRNDPVSSGLHVDGPVEDFSKLIGANAYRFRTIQMFYNYAWKCVVSREPKVVQLKSGSTESISKNTKRRGLSFMTYMWSPNFST